MKAKEEVKSNSGQILSDDELEGILGKIKQKYKNPHVVIIPDRQLKEWHQNALKLNRSDPPGERGAMGTVYRDVAGVNESGERKQYSIMAMNLETLEDVDEVIQYCNRIKIEISLSRPRKSDYKRAVEHGYSGPPGVVGVSGPKECGDWTVSYGGPGPCKVPCKDPEGRPLYMGADCPHSWIKERC